MTTAEPQRSCPEGLPLRILLTFNPTWSVRAFLYLLPASGQRGNLRISFAHWQALDVGHAEEAKNVI